MNINPLKIIRDLSKRQPKLAVAIYAGLAVYAAAIIVICWKVDYEVATGIGWRILVFSFVVFFLVSLTTSKLVMLILEWFAVLLIISSCCALFITSVFPGKTPISPAYCLVEFWKPCLTPGGLADQYADRNSQKLLEPVKSIVAPPLVPVSESEYKVFVQFAGLIRREDIKAMMVKQTEVGWRMQGQERGGERTAEAIGYNEIRYRSIEDEPAARKLAIEIQGANLTSKPISIVKAPNIAEKTLEVWISRT